MRVKLPETEYPFLRLVVVWPEGEFDLIVSSSDTEAIIELPEGTPEDEVEVMAIFRDADMNEPPDVWTKVLKWNPRNPLRPKSDSKIALDD